jgi:hypothetical protein
MTFEDGLVVHAGVAALRRVSTLIRQTPHMVESAREPLLLRDFEGLAHRLEEPEEWEWDLGKEFAFLSPQDIESVMIARELLVARGTDAQHVKSLETLETFLRRFLTYVE